MIPQPGPAIGAILQNAIAFDFKRLAERNVTIDALPQMVDELFDLLAIRKVDYVLVGGIAMLQYVDGRNTEDIDLIVALSALRRMPEIQIQQQDRNFVRGRYQGLQIDLLLTANQLFEMVTKRFATTGRYQDRTVSVATIEGLLLLKLYALPSLYRQGNYARVGLYENDIATLMQAYTPDVSALLATLSSHLSATDIGEVRNIVAELQSRIERFDRTFRDQP